MSRTVWWRHLANADAKRLKGMMFCSGVLLLIEQVLDIITPTALPDILSWDV